MSEKVVNPAMNNRDAISNELKSLPSSLPLTNSPSFFVPEGYFEGLAGSILAKVKRLETSGAQTELTELSPLLAGLSKAMPYGVPSSYFDDNLQNVSAIGAEEVSPVLAGIGKGLPYRVPATYFDDLPLQLLAKVNEPKAKVVPLFRRTWGRVAAAAVIAGGLLIGGAQVFTNKSVNDTAHLKPVDTASTLVAQAQSPVRQEIKKLSTEDLENFVRTVPAGAAKIKKIASKEAAGQLLKDVSVSDMENFLSDAPPTDEELFATDEP